MKIIYTADLHGKKALYARLFQLTGRFCPHAIIVGGDILPNRGPIETSIKDQGDFITGFLSKWLGEIKDSFPSSDFYTMMGNDDWLANMPLLEELESQGLLKLIHEKKYRLRGGFELIGYGNIPPTPFTNKESERIDTSSAPREPQLFIPCVSTGKRITRIDVRSHFSGLPSIEEELKAMPPVTRYGKTVCVMHAPPYQSGLDVLYDGQPIGSHAIRQFIEEKQPYLTLHGHIHEAPSISGTYVSRIGKTICINPGQSLERLHAVTFELENVMESLHHTIFDQGK